MKRELILKRIAFSLCMSYKNHKSLYDNFLERIKEYIK